jgi:hypothetical protein
LKGLALGKKTTSNWKVATEAILEQGWVNIETGGGADWNKEVASKLSAKSGKKVLFIGESPDYNKGEGTYRFALEAKNNKQAAILLDEQF